jgi:hypothetical protein
MDINRDDDENEENETPSKKRKRAPKKEEEDFGGFAGQTATQFKLETISSEEEGVANLEDEEYVPVPCTQLSPNPGC